jgi:hypothetical protein
MDDVDGPRIAQRVYHELFAGNSEIIDPSVVPYALADAVATLRNEGMSPTRWAPYVHHGI